jgi:hypothetical protein
MGRTAWWAVRRSGWCVSCTRSRHSPPASLSSEYSRTIVLQRSLRHFSTCAMMIISINA